MKSSAFQKLVGVLIDMHNLIPKVGGVANQYFIAWFPGLPDP